MLNRFCLRCCSSINAGSSSSSFQESTLYFLKSEVSSSLLIMARLVLSALPSAVEAPQFQSLNCPFPGQPRPLFRAASNRCSAFKSAADIPLILPTKHFFPEVYASHPASNIHFIVKSLTDIPCISIKAEQEKNYRLIECKNLLFFLY